MSSDTDTSARARAEEAVELGDSLHIKYKEILVGRSETIPTGDFKNIKLYNQLTVEVLEGADISEIVNRLHRDCQAMLEQQKEEQGLNETLTAIETEVEIGNEDSGFEPDFVTADKLLEQEAKDEDDDLDMAWEGYNPPDTRNRSLKELLQGLGVKSVNHAGYIRWQREISYIEWKILVDHFNGKEKKEVVL